MPGLQVDLVHQREQVGVPRWLVDLHLFRELAELADEAAHQVESTTPIRRTCGSSKGSFPRPLSAIGLPWLGRVAE